MPCSIPNIIWEEDDLVSNTAAGSAPSTTLDITNAYDARGKTKVILALEDGNDLTSLAEITEYAWNGTRYVLTGVTATLDNNTQAILELEGGRQYAYAVVYTAGAAAWAIKIGYY